MSSGWMRFLLIGCGTLCVALGVIGIFLPLMPTTVFLLMAAACYARSSDRFYQKLVNHRVLGHYIRSSREGRGMKRRDKAITLVLLWVSIGATMIWTAHTIWLRLLLLAIATGVTVHVAKLPAFRPSVDPSPERTTV
jgi:uncharacterized membrane protein YbaN (DUF454 family)